MAITSGTLHARRLGGVDVVVAAEWHLLVGGGALVLLPAAGEGVPVIVWTPRFIATVVLGQIPSGWTAAGLGAVLASMWMVLRSQRSAPLMMREVPTAQGTDGEF